MSMHIPTKRLFALGACLCLIFSLIAPGLALGCEGAGEEKETLEDKGQLWEVRAIPFHEQPKAEQKRLVTIELVNGGPETITGLNVGKPKDFKITNPNGCEKKYAAGTLCQIEMEFLVTGKPNGRYFADLELVFKTPPNLAFDKVPVGTIP